MFVGNLVVLVNSSPRKGDPFSPLFLFLMVVEGLSDFFGKEVSLGIFLGFNVASSNLVISHLQYVDDTPI